MARSSETGHGGGTRWPTLLALYWLVQGHGYEITSVDVWGAYRSTRAAAERHGSTAEVMPRIRELVASERAGDRFVTKALGRELGLGARAGSRRWSSDAELNLPRRR